VRRRAMIQTVDWAGRLEITGKSRLRLVTPATVNRTVTPRRPPNSDLRTREHLTEAEVERLIEAAKGNRHGHRDATMVLVAYRHGLRASELTDLRWEQVDFRTIESCRKFILASRIATWGGGIVLFAMVFGILKSAGLLFCWQWGRSGARSMRCGIRR